MTVDYNASAERLQLELLVCRLELYRTGTEQHLATAIATASVCVSVCTTLSARPSDRNRIWHILGKERWTGDRLVLGSKPAAEISLRNCGNLIYPALPVFLGGDTKHRRSFLFGVYVRGSKISHQSALEMCTTCRGLNILPKRRTPL